MARQLVRSQCACEARLTSSRYVVSSQDCALSEVMSNCRSGCWLTKRAACITAEANHPQQDVGGGSSGQAWNRSLVVIDRIEFCQLRQMNDSNTRGEKFHTRGLVVHSQHPYTLNPPLTPPFLIPLPPPSINFATTQKIGPQIVLQEQSHRGWLVRRELVATCATAERRDEVTGWSADLSAVRSTD